MPEHDAQYGRKQDHPNGGWCFLPYFFVPAVHQPQQHKHRNGPAMRCKAALRAGRIAAQRGKAHRDRRGQDHGHHTGAHPVQHCLYPGVPEHAAQHRRHQQDDDKGRQHHAQRSHQCPRQPGLRRTNEGGHVHGQRPRGGLRHRNKTQEFALGEPAVAQHHLPHQRDHAVAAAKRQGSDHQKVPEQGQTDHFAPASFRSCCTPYTARPAAPLSRM